MEKSHIEWTDHTFNPWIGCTKVSAGCTHCYAETLMDTRYGRVKWGSGQPRSRTVAANWQQPLRWNRQAKQAGARAKVFCASLADWLDHEVPIAWLADLLLLIDQTPHLDWLLLTKRIEQCSDRLHKLVREAEEPADTIASYWLDGDPPQNVWLGTTIESQKAADDRLPALIDIEATVRFLSVEPLLEAVTLNLTDIDQVIVGGESGTGARPCHIDWIRLVVQQCQAADVPVFVKQLGTNPVGLETKPSDRKGGLIDEFPLDLQLRQFPRTKVAA